MKSENCQVHSTVDRMQTSATRERPPVSGALPCAGFAVLGEPQAWSLGMLCVVAAGSS